MADAPKRSEAIGMAINLEEEGIKFYREAAGRMTDPFAKQMFLSISEDEKRHKRIFEAMAKEAGVVPADVSQMDQEGPIQRIRQILCEIGRKASQDLDPEDNQVKALDVALAMEEKAWQFYNAAAEASADSEEKEILRKIATEENEHYRILEDTRLYLTDQAKWNIKEEKPLIDGG